jgi:hypothetical protein
MPEMLSFPPAVVIGLWLNAAHSGSVSPTDAANAIETIIDQVDLRTDGEWPSTGISSLLELVKAVCSTSTPVAVGLPADGDPAGIPSNVLVKIERASGVVAINRDLLLFQTPDGPWTLAGISNTVMHYDLNQTRRNLIIQITTSAELLAASDLLGDETEIVGTLDAFQAQHLPPHLSDRSIEALEMAAKIVIVASGAISNSAAIHSPSLDRIRLENLELLICESRRVLQSVVTA